MAEEEPKTAYELILERLKKKDHDEGVVEERPLTDDQRARIAELRQVAKAKLAEREIFFNQSRRKAADPEALAALEEQYGRERERIQSEQDRKIEQVRSEGR